MITSITSTLVLASLSVASVGPGSLPPSDPGTPVTTIAVVYCPNGSTQGPKHNICLDDVAVKPAPKSDDVTETKGPKTVTRLVLARYVPKGGRTGNGPKGNEGGGTRRDSVIHYFA